MPTQAEIDAALAVLRSAGQMPTGPVAYATLEDMQDFGLPQGAWAMMKPSTVERALRASSAVADSYLRGQYQLPLISWGLDLTQAVCTLAAWDLMSDRGYNPEGHDEKLKERADATRDWLKGLAGGSVHLSSVKDASGDASMARGGPAAFIQTRPLRGW